jgi:predicted MarR family transcription regulator
MKSLGMGLVDYRLLEQWEASQRWRLRARAEAEADAELEEALVRALRHIDRRRAEAAGEPDEETFGPPTIQLVELDDR